MADLITSFNYTMHWEDSTLSGAVTPDPTKDNPNARARFGVNSASHPEAEREGFFDMSRDAALQYAEDVFKYSYFSPMNGYQIRNQDICNKIVDMAFNQGCNQAGKIVQRALNSILAGPFAIDGIIGAKTVDGINACNPSDLLPALKEKAKDFYVGLAASHPPFQKNLNGWIARAEA